MKNIKEYLDTTNINEVSKDQLEYKVSLIQQTLSDKGVFDTKSKTLIADKTGNGYSLAIKNNENGAERDFGGNRGRYSAKEFLIFLDAVIAAFEEIRNPVKF